MNTKLIYKVLSGTATANEKKALAEWKATSESNWTEFDDIRLLWSRGEFYEGSNSKLNDNQRLEIILKHINQQNAYPSRAFFLCTFAALLLALACYFSMKLPFQDKPKQVLHFQNTPIAAVITKLESTYGISIQVEDSKILDCEFTGMFYNVVVPEDVVCSLARSVNAEYKRYNEKKFTVTGSGCHTQSGAFKSN